MKTYGEDPIRFLAKQGVAAGAAAELVEVIEKCKTIDDVRRVLGDPDFVSHWDATKEEKALSELKARGIPPRNWERNRWRTCHSYSCRWFPAFLQVMEHDDGRISFSFGVTPKGRSQQPPP
jgi:hypothetical protein